MPGAPKCLSDEEMNEPQVTAKVTPSVEKEERSVSADVGNASQHLFTVPEGAFCFNKFKNLHFQETHVVTSDIKLVVSNLFW